MKRILGFLVLALVAVLALSACGGASVGSTGSSSSAAVFNDADVTFVQSMIPHHTQAVTMAKMAASHASSPAVKDLATKIDAAQGPEIDTMTGWLKAWGKNSTAGSSGGMDGMGGMTQGSSAMPGMMGDDQMRSLDAANGAAFDQMFLTMMMSHHQGAIEMAKSEQANGKNADAVALAKKIEADQTAELAQMQDLLKS